MKKIFVPLIFFLFLQPYVWSSSEIPKLQGRVNDYANMISASTKVRLEEELKTFERSDSTQLVILTIPSLEGLPIEDYSIKVAEGWKLGQAVKDNGILFLVAKQERKLRIEVGRGLEGRLTDLMAGRIIDLVIKPRFKRGDFDGGFVSGVSSIIDATRGEFKSEAKPSSRKPLSFSSRSMILYIFFFLFLIILFPFILAQRALRGNRPGDRSHRGIFGGPFFTGGGWSSGGGGGGSDSFGGGGGGFGGGGASGDW